MFLRTSCVISYVENKHYNYNSITVYSTDLRHESDLDVRDLEGAAHGVDVTREVCAARAEDGCHPQAGLVARCGHTTPRAEATGDM